LKLYADEGIDRQIVDALRRAGFDVAYAAETDPSSTDDSLLGKAAAERRLLLTSDKDFGELVYRLGKANDGVVLVRLSGLSADMKARLVVEAFSTRSEMLRIRKRREA
jgi:predicted nuclease of predicted toxin-antitoxin system